MVKYNYLVWLEYMVFRKLVNPTTAPITGDRDELSMPLMLDDINIDIFQLTFTIILLLVLLDTTWLVVSVLSK